MLASVIDFILHIDQHLLSLSAQYGVWIYAILFLIVFCETGLIVTPSCPAIRSCLPPAGLPRWAVWIFI